MMKSFTLLKYCLAVLILGLVSCEEEVGFPVDEQEVVASKPTGSGIGEDVTLEPGSSLTITGVFVDAQGLTSVTIVNADLGLNETINLDGALTYELSHTFTVPTDATPGDHVVVITVTNNVELSTAYNQTITIPEPPPACLDDYTVFDGENINGTSSNGAYADDPYEVSFTGSVAGDKITLTGEYTNYQGNTLTMQAVPGEDDTAGTLVWTEELLGSDGYAIYHAIPTPGKTSTYNACTGEMTIYYDYEWNYEAGAGWEYWYSAELTVAIEPCEDTYSIFDAATLSGQASKGGYTEDPFDISFDASISGDMITLSGDYTDYQGSTLTLQAVPDSEDPTKGTLVWTEEDLGSDGGAIYHAIPTDGETSTYDACAGTMTINFDYEWNYEAGAGWEYWYSATLTVAIE
ncbi:MAG: hypothetical protein ABJO02_19325 [Reichenbachiella sp.]|uniref:hypothetical protein n=1 Tax=Reichenbachiella sp. TaxID=2184521 RepID=UPI003297D37F